MSNPTSISSFNNTSSLRHKITSLVYGKYYSHPYLFPRVTSNETYLVSFPRSGNTWLRYLLTSLIHGQEATTELVRNTIPDIHRYKPDKKRKPTSKPLIVKSHTPFVDIPAKVIYVVRDGREAILSYYYLQLKEEKIKPEISPLEFYFDEDIWPCPWHVHVAGWLDGLENWSKERYKIIRYEDLVKSPDQELFSIAKFIGLPTTDKSIERAIALNTKEHLKTVNSKDNQGRLISVVGTEKPKWQTVLSDEAITKYEALAGAELQRLNYGVRNVT